MDKLYRSHFINCQTCQSTEHDSVNCLMIQYHGLSFDFLTLSTSRLLYILFLCLYAHFTWTLHSQWPPSLELHLCILASVRVKIHYSKYIQKSNSTLPMSSLSHCIYFGFKFNHFSLKFHLYPTRNKCFVSILANFFLNICSSKRFLL